MSDPLQDRLDIVWENDPPRRYIARSIGGSEYWLAYDRILRRSISNAELLTIPLDDLRIDAA